MSMDRCRCGVFVDTDEDCGAYTIETEDCEEISLEYVLCPNCRDTFQGLLELKVKVNQFTQDVFDWVRTVPNKNLLGDLYDFEKQINKLTNPKKEVRNATASQ